MSVSASEGSLDAPMLRWNSSRSAMVWYCSAPASLDITRTCNERARKRVATVKKRGAASTSEIGCSADCVSPAAHARNELGARGRGNVSEPASPNVPPEVRRHAAMNAKALELFQQGFS